MKKKFYSFAAFAFFCASLLFVSCNRDVDEPTSGAFDGRITATVVNGSQLNGIVSTVRLVYFEDWGGDVTLATGTFSNGGFSLNLPEAVPSRYLFNIEEIFGGEISDTRTNITFIGIDGGPLSLMGYNREGFPIGQFNRIDRAYSATMWAIYIYVDRGVRITGSDDWSDFDNISLTRGWNIMYTNPNSGGIITTKDPGGLRWFFYPWD